MPNSRDYFFEIYNLRIVLSSFYFKYSIICK